MVILWQDYNGKGNLRKSFLKYGWEKVSIWECLRVNRSKRIILVCVCGRHENELERGIEKIPYSEKFDANISSWSYDMEGHAKKCVERKNRTGEQNNSTMKQSRNTILKEAEMGSVGDLSKVCSQIVLKCLYLPRIGRPDILWYVNELARAITEWTRACDKRLARLISYIHHTCDFKQYCHVGNTAKQCRLGLFQDSELTRDSEDSKPTSGGLLCIF